MKATPDEHETRWQLLRRERFARDAAVFVPRRLIADDGSVDLSGFMAEVNAIVATRGMVLADGQVIATPFSDRIGYELFGDDSVFDTPPARPWGAAQRAFFGLADPHQMAEEPDGYLWWHVMAYVVEPFLADGELIVGLVHGSADRSPFTCECHDSTVVYTTRARLVCMSCGYTHLVLPAPLEFPPRVALTADDWIAPRTPRRSGRPIAGSTRCEISSSSLGRRPTNWLRRSRAPNSTVPCWPKSASNQSPSRRSLPGNSTKDRSTSTSSATLETPSPPDSRPTSPPIRGPAT